MLDVTPPFQLAAERLFDAISGAETRAIIEELGPLDRRRPSCVDRAQGRGRATGAADTATARRGGARGSAVVRRGARAARTRRGGAAFVLGGLEGDVFELFHHCKLASALGLPAAVVPVARSPTGLPIGVQVIGRRGREAEVLGVARAIELRPATIAR